MRSIIYPRGAMNRNAVRAQGKPSEMPCCALRLLVCYDNAVTDFAQARSHLGYVLLHPRVLPSYLC